MVKLYVDKRHFIIMLCFSLIASSLTGIMALPSAASGSFVKQRVYNGSFTDIAESDWFYRDVKAAYEWGIIDGRSSDRFDPDGMLTIAEVIKVAASIHKYYHTGSGAFTPVGEWYTVYADYALGNNIIDIEYDDYNKPAKRHQAAVILSRALPPEALQTINTVTGIPDIEAGAAYRDEVYLLYGAGILVGSDDRGSFMPETNIRRSEISALINRLCDPEKRISVPGNNITYNYYDYMMSRNKQLAFEYGDMYFAKPSNILNGKLAKASMALCTAALGDTATGSNRNIIQAYEDMGYTVLTQQNYDTEQTDDNSDFAAYTIASKRTTINNKNYTIYGIALRGSLELAEWYSNFDIGESGDGPHAGFTNAADGIYSALTSRITGAKDDTIIWITGHSRGASISNIIGARLNQNAEYAQRKNIFTYTFGCPAVTKTPYAYDNIFNFNNPGDIIAYIPFTLWGYGINGIEIRLPTDDDTLSKVKSNFSGIKGGMIYLGRFETDGFADLVTAWCPTKESFYTSEKGGISPYNLFVSIISLGNGDSNVIETAAILYRHKYSREGMRVALYLAENLIPIYHSHIYDTYLAWLEAVY
ncbi:MAG: S-layer homology domain-containing protein [Eubacteriales bacterium]|nr:S-layer homology domain-containing protein [Eubacteriales bacterium]